MTYNNVIEQRDFKRIYRLNNLTDPKTFWGEVRRLTRNTHSDHALGRWQVLAEIRYDELVKEN